MFSSDNRQLAFLFLILVVGTRALAQDATDIQLPPPQTDGGRPLMQVLRDRQSIRDFRPDKLPLQTLSNLLWAAFGINRPDGRRTAPSASNKQEIDVYVATADGLYVYDAKTNRLRTCLGTDIRAETGTQSFVGKAPVNLVYVADLAKAGIDSRQDEMDLGTDAGVILRTFICFAPLRASLQSSAAASTEPPHQKR
jgi:hypothetical protein